MAAVVAGMTDVDVLMLARFSKIGARDACQAALPGVPVLTAPDETVRKLKRLLGG